MGELRWLGRIRSRVRLGLMLVLACSGGCKHAEIALQPKALMAGLYWPVWVGRWWEYDIEQSREAPRRNRVVIEGGQVEGGVTWFRLRGGGELGFPGSVAVGASDILVDYPGRHSLLKSCRVVDPPEMIVLRFEGHLYVQCEAGESSWEYEFAPGIGIVAIELVAMGIGRASWRLAAWGRSES